MKIQVDFYKQSGKWYEGGVVDIGTTAPWDTGEVIQAVVDNQGMLMDGWQGQYYVVVGNVSDDDDFCMRHYMPSDCQGLIKASLRPAL